MTIRTAKLATILMVGAALAATPVLAQAVTAGNQGPAGIPTNRDAPLTLPGTLTPMPTPKVDPAFTVLRVRGVPIRLHVSALPDWRFCLSQLSPQRSTLSTTGSKPTSGT